jgi:hypothetical protein
MIKEMRDLLTRKAVKVVDIPANRKLLGNTWVNSLKSEAEAKSRLCIQGFSQVPGIDYKVDEIESPTLDLQMVMLMICLLLKKHMYEVTLDAVGAFQIPKLEEPLYTRMPQGLKEQPGKCLMLLSSLQGLVQASFQWHKIVHEGLISMGFKLSSSVNCLYYQYDQEGTILSMAGIYVDDFRVQSECKDVLEKIKLDLGKLLPLQEKDQQKYLGMNIVHDREKGTVTIDQINKINDILKTYGMTDCYGVDTPAAPGTKLIRSIRGEVVKFPYNELLGSLLWIGRVSRPEILYAVNQCAQHAKAPNRTHVEALKRILRYLKGTINLKLKFKYDGNESDEFELVAYADADFAGEPEENENGMKSMSGIFVGIKGIGYIFGQSKLQTIVAKCTAEAEYVALSDTSTCVVGLRNVLDEIGINQNTPSIIMEDNQSTMKIATSHMSNAKFRAVKIHYHCIKQYIKDKEVQLQYVPTGENIADIFTKALCVKLFTYLRDKIYNVDF